MCLGAKLVSAVHNNTVEDEILARSKLQRLVILSVNRQYLINQ